MANNNNNNDEKNKSKYKSTEMRTQNTIDEWQEAEKGLIYVFCM